MWSSVVGLRCEVASEWKVPRTLSNAYAAWFGSTCTRWLARVAKSLSTPWCEARKLLEHKHPHAQPPTLQSGVHAQGWSEGPSPGELGRGSQRTAAQSTPVGGWVATARRGVCAAARRHPNGVRVNLFATLFEGASDPLLSLDRKRVHSFVPRSTLVAIWMAPHRTQQVVWVPSEWNTRSILAALLFNSTHD